MLCIVGADGFLGTYFTRLVLNKNDGTKLVTLNHNSPVFGFSENKKDFIFELQDNNSIKNAAAVLSKYEDIRILFLASVHNPDSVKRDPEQAEYINTVCYENFLKATKDLDIRKLIYASSDTVYGESRDGYIFTEKDSPSPVNIYGRQKLLAEEITRKYSYTAARFSYMCGPSLSPGKIHFCDQIISALKKNEAVQMLTDWIRPSLHYRTASELIYKLLLNDQNIETINICSDAPFSKYELGLKIAAYTGADSSLVIPATKEQLGIFSEKRADTIMMDNSLLKNTLRLTEIDFTL